MQDIQQKSVQDSVVDAMLNVWAQTKGRHYVSVTGSSMLPLVRDGDSVLITHGCDGIRRGDVVVFRRDGKLVAHRVIRREVDQGSNSVTFITKGDNVFHLDPPVRGGEIIGRVLCIRKGNREISLETVVWQMLGWGIAVGTLSISRLHSRSRNFIQSLPCFRSKCYRGVLNRFRHAVFLYLRKMVFFIFCGLR